MKLQPGNADFISEVGSINMGDLLVLTGKNWVILTLKINHFMQ